MEYVEQVTAEKDTFDVVSAEQTAHERRVQALERKMARLERELVDTEIALKHERLIAEQVSKRRRRFGLDAFIDAQEDESAEA